MLMATGHEHPENGWERRLAPGYGRLNDAVREAMAMASAALDTLVGPRSMQRALAGLHPVAGRSAYHQRLVGSWMTTRALADAAFAR